MHIRIWISVAALSAFLCAAPALAQGLTQQQERMQSCNADVSAKGLKGDERQSFMSDCLRAEKSERPSAAGGRK